MTPLVSLSQLPDALTATENLARSAVQPRGIQPYMITVFACDTWSTSAPSARIRIFCYEGT